MPVMPYTCHYCDKESDNAKTITLYNEEGLEDQLKILCDSCYADWLLSLNG
ncbi:hypothetical protein [Cohnella sp.]|uniref:hypothetical protein n=1 Tax=Cohnella sp. TaxID=1883426 RepID=UPI0035666F59